MQRQKSLLRFRVGKKVVAVVSLLSNFVNKLAKIRRIALMAGLSMVPFAINLYIFVGSNQQNVLISTKKFSAQKTFSTLQIKLPSSQSAAWI